MSVTYDTVVEKPQPRTPAIQAATPRSQAFLVIGTMFLLPIILGYTIWSYWVFRGKVQAGSGYH